MSDVINSYTAGIIDGEGSVMLIASHSGKMKAPCVSVTNTSLELLEFLKENYGGNIVSQKTYKAHHKKSYMWKLWYDNAIEFLKIVSPYMKELKKIHRANLIINEYKNVTIRNGKYTKELLDKKELFELNFFSHK